MIELDIEYTKEDKQNYWEALRKHEKTTKPKYQYITYLITILLSFSLLAGMFSSNIIQLRYFYFTLLFIIPILLKLYFDIKNRLILRLKEKHPTIERPLQKVIINDRIITMDTFDSIYTYKSNWPKYLFIYDENIAISSSDLSGVILPKRYLSEDLKKEILKMFNEINQIKIS